ncbi:hypothetical protein D5H75_17820 [Bailinhaonella thermotolerans]|uniref:Uncharacterized protein n=1 Tax=Bailinhaonella thermotolerans TaxID=1070861 RepID=A0A3A4B2H0_9ACTN|nr:hypothetical protein D5H75_17820 [Bailinhaonella thermotolerans]
MARPSGAAADSRASLSRSRRSGACSAQVSASKLAARRGRFSAKLSTTCAQVFSKPSRGSAACVGTATRHRSTQSWVISMRASRSRASLEPKW